MLALQEHTLLENISIQRKYRIRIQSMLDTSLAFICSCNSVLFIRVSEICVLIFHLAQKFFCSFSTINIVCLFIYVGSTVHTLNTEYSDGFIWYLLWCCDWICYSIVVYTNKWKRNRKPWLWLQSNIKEQRRLNRI